MTVRVLQGHVLERLAELPATSVHVCVTSPPYWGLRAYGTPPQVWGGAADCAHAWGDEGTTGRRRGAEAGKQAKVGNTVARVCPPELATGAFCQRCGAWRGELGSEPTLDLFVAHLVEVFAAVRRVLRDDGTLWINLGDCYATGANGWSAEQTKAAGRDDRTFRDKPFGTASKELPAGNLAMAPARFALAMQAAGWCLRSEITLCKTAPMPESVSGSRWERCRVKVAPGHSPPRYLRADGSGQAANHEARVPIEGGRGFPPGSEWADCPGCPKCREQGGYVQRWGSGRPTSATEKLYLFTKGGRYFFDQEAVRVPLAAWEQRDGEMVNTQGGQGHARHRRPTEALPAGMRLQSGMAPGARMVPNPAGRNLWNYVMWAPEPLKEGHYAAFPRWLPRLAIQAGTSERGVCPGCGAPWLRLIDRKTAVSGREPGSSEYSQRDARFARGGAFTDAEATTLGWRPSCACPPHEPAPAVCLDPFAGSGTTLIEANALGRHGWGIELQAKYVQIAHQRLAHQPLSLFAHEGAAALGVEAAGD